MSNGKDNSDRQRKIDNILSLISGAKKPEDIHPHCIMFIGYGNEDQPHFYQVNDKLVSKEFYDETVANANFKKARVTYGQATPEGQEEENRPWEI